MAQGKGLLREGPPAALVRTTPRFPTFCRWLVFTLLAHGASAPIAGSKASAAATRMEADAGGDIRRLPPLLYNTDSGRIAFAASRVLPLESETVSDGPPPSSSSFTPSRSASFPEASVQYKVLKDSQGSQASGASLQQQQQLKSKRKIQWMAAVIAAICLAALAAFRFRKASRPVFLSPSPSLMTEDEQDPSAGFYSFLGAVDRLALSIGTAEARGYMRVLWESSLSIKMAKKDIAEAQAAVAAAARFPCFRSEQQMKERQEEQQQPLKDLVSAEQRLQRELQAASDRVFRLLNVAYRQAAALMADAEPLDAGDTFLVHEAALSSSIPQDLWQASVITLRSLEGVSKLEKQRACLVYKELLELQEEQRHLQQRLQGNPYLQQTEHMLRQQQHLMEQVTEVMNGLGAINKGRSSTRSLSDAVQRLATKAYRALQTQDIAELVCSVRGKKELLSAKGVMAAAVLPRCPPEVAGALEGLLRRNETIAKALRELLGAARRHMQATNISQMVEATETAVRHSERLLKLADAAFLHMTRGSAEEKELLAGTPTEIQAARQSLVVASRILRKEAEANRSSLLKTVQQVSWARDYLLLGAAEDGGETGTGAEGDPAGKPKGGSSRRPFVNEALAADLLDRLHASALRAIETVDSVKAATRAAETAVSLPETERLLAEAYQRNTLAIRAKKEADLDSCTIDLLVFLEKDLAHSAEKIAWVRTRATDLTTPQGQHVNSMLEKFAIGARDAAEAQDLPEIALAAAGMRSAALLLEDVGLQEEVLRDHEELLLPTTPPGNHPPHRETDRGPP